MLYLSEIMMQHPEVDSFETLLEVVRQQAQTEIFFRIDVKPQFADTPDDWEDRLEATFT
jgi:hypothetical protein